MKTLFASLLGTLVLAACSTASAAVFVHAGPVTVGVGVGRHHLPVRPVVARPFVARPIAPSLMPVVAPVAIPPAVVGAPGRLTLNERRDIREEVQELRRDVWQSGSHLNPSERREIRDDVQDVRREIWQAWRN